MITVDRQHSLLVARAPFARKNELKAVPGARWDPADKAWVFPATAHTARELSALPHCLLLPSAKELLAAPEPPARAWPDLVYPFNDPTKRPWTHQVRAHAYSAKRPGSVLRLKMRMGKTLVSLALAVSWEARLILVVCPVAVMPVWRDEAEEHVPGCFRVVLIDDDDTDKKAKRLEQEISLAGVSGEPLLAIVNYESVWRGKLGKLVKAVDWDLMIADECHKLKSPASNVSMFMAKVKAKRRLGPTGTFLPNGVADAYGQMRFIDPSIFGTSAAVFKARYRALVEPITYEPHPNGLLLIKPHFNRNKEVQGVRGARWSKILGCWVAPDSTETRATLDRMAGGAEEQMKDFTARLSRAVISIDYDEADVALPEQEDRAVFVDLSPAAQKAYEQMRQHMIAQVERGEIVAANALVKSLRLSQIASGVVQTDEGDLVELCDAKPKAIRELLEGWYDEDRQPAVVFCRFHNDLNRVEQIASDMGLSYGEISGRRKDGQDGRFLALGSSLIGVQLQSGGLGLDFHASRLGVFVTLSWSASDYEQARYRFLGSRQRNAVTFPHVIARGTVDEAIWTALQGKIDLAEAVMGHLRRR